MREAVRKQDPKSDPRRRCLKYEHWPAADRAAWDAAVVAGDVLDGGGPASQWAPTTVKTVKDGYGRYLTFLALQGWLDPDAAPGDRLTKERLRAYIAELQQDVAPITLRNRITNLSEALRVMAPGSDYLWLRRARGRLKARARPSRNKRRQIVPVQDLFALGLTLMQQAESGVDARALWQASRYRDGLMIMLLACRPIRRQSLVDMRLRLHLVKQDEVYQIALDETLTKNRRRYDRPLDPALSPFIDRYLAHYRPVLLSSREDDHLWISWRQLPLSAAVAYERIVARTTAAFGFAIPPHRFRDSAMTSLGEAAPELVWLAPALLHHADLRIAREHYDHARNSAAVAQWQSRLVEERRVMRRKESTRLRPPGKEA